MTALRLQTGGEHQTSPASLGYVFFVTTRHTTHSCRPNFVTPKVGPIFVATNLLSQQT